MNASQLRLASTPAFAAPSKPPVSDQSDRFEPIALDIFEKLQADKPRGARWEDDVLVQNLSGGHQNRCRASGSPRRTLIETFRFEGRSLESSFSLDIIVRCGAIHPGAASIDGARAPVEVLTTGHVLPVKRERAAIDICDRADEARATSPWIESLDAVSDLPSLGVPMPFRAIYEDVLSP